MTPRTGVRWHGREAAAGPAAMQSRSSSVGYTETGIVGKSHVDIIPTTDSILHIDLIYLK